jgi:hypothetical protein
MGQRRLIAGLRITRQDEALLGAVRPLFPEADSEGDLAYRLWRRGLELTLAELAGLGITLPPELSEDLLATLVAHRLLLCLPLLRRTGTLALLGSELAPALAMPISPPDGSADIDTAAAATIAGMGGGDFGSLGIPVMATTCSRGGVYSIRDGWCVVEVGRCSKRRWNNSLTCRTCG